MVLLYVDLFGSLPGTAEAQMLGLSRFLRLRRVLGGFPADAGTVTKSLPLSVGKGRAQRAAVSPCSDEVLHKGSPGGPPGPLSI